MPNFGNIQPLGDSQFNYQDLTVFRFIHYYQQIINILKLKPSRVLEIGPGDHTITDFLRRKGIYVKTFDNDKNLFPDYYGDIREDFGIKEKFDLVLASEVLEHINFKYVETVIENIYKVIDKNGYLIISLPYSTLRLFPERQDYGRIASCEGRIYTFIPIGWIYPLYALARGIHRFIIKKENFKEAFVFTPFKQYPDDRFDVHHWDLGYQPNLQKKLSKIFKKHFLLEEKKIYINTNCIFYILKKLD
jgi:septum formation topological specificity factor MinE